MRWDGRDNTIKLWSFISIVFPSKNKSENKTKFNGYSDFEESLLWSDSKSIRNNDDNKIDFIDNSKER